MTPRQHPYLHDCDEEAEDVGPAAPGTATIVVCGACGRHLSTINPTSKEETDD